MDHGIESILLGSTDISHSFPIRLKYNPFRESVKYADGSRT